MSFKAAVLGLSDKNKPQPTAYTCPVTGQKAFIKRLTISEREHYSTKIQEAGKGEVNATAFSLIMCDKDGELLFSEKDIATLANLPEDVLLSAIAEFNSRPSLTVSQAEKN